MPETELMNAIVQQITLYTTQVDEFDRFSENYVMTCVAFAGVLLGVVVAFIGLRNRTAKDATGTDKSYQWRVLSIAIFLISALTALCFYAFSLNSRKVALYRGYLRFLEEKLNSLAGSNIAYYDSRIMKDIFEGRFLTNNWGFILVIYLVFLIVLGCILISLYCNKRDFGVWLWERTYHREKSFFRIFYPIFLASFNVICIFLISIFIIDLANNSNVVEQVYEYCQTADLTAPIAPVIDVVQSLP